MPRFVSLRSIRLLPPLFVAAALLAGCASTGGNGTEPFVPEARLARFNHVAIAPLDLEAWHTDLAGNTVEAPDKRAVISGRLSTALEHQTGLRYVSTYDLRDETAKRELADVQAMLRTFTAEALARDSEETATELRVGRIDALADSLAADGVLLVYTYDRSSSAARRAASVLPTLVGRTTGFNFGPHPGITVSSAALVARDGRVVWFHTQSSNGDPRLSEDSASLVQHLVAGLPLNQ